MRRSLLLGLFFLFAHCLVSLAQTRVNGCGEGTQIILQSGSSSPGACGGVGQDSKLSFRVKPFYTTYAIVVTDDEYNIIAVSRKREIDFSTLPGGSYRVYGLFYNGTLLAEPGMNPDRDRLGSICYGFTDNFIAVNAESPEGGMVTTVNGRSEAAICLDPSFSKQVVFANSGNGLGRYQYIVTDTAGTILALPAADSFDFSAIEPMTSRVYGVAYTGDLSIAPGDQLDPEKSLASGCFSLSDNFIAVRQVVPNGGQLRFANGASDLSVCTEAAGVVRMETQEDSFGPYAYFVTDRNDLVVDVFFEEQIDLSSFLPGSYRIYGAAYTGELQVQVGDDILSVAISDQCFDLSEDILSFSSPNLSTSGFSLLNGDLSSTLCRSVSGNTLLSFADNEEGGIQSRVYLLTLPDSTVLDIFTENTIDFSIYDHPDLLVWRLAYTGTLFLQRGDQLGAIVYSSDCALLSEQAVAIHQVFLDGGGIRLEDGATEKRLCFEADLGRVFKFDLSDFGGGKRALFVTDPDGNILDIQDRDSLVITPDLPSSFQVFGLVYSGTLRLNLGNNITNNPLSTECFELSTNAVSFTTNQVAGGRISFSDGSTEKEVCVMDEVSNVLTFDAKDPAATADYRFVLTDQADRIILALTGNSLDFNLAMEGRSRIYGVSYTGEWTAKAQDNIFTAELSDACFALSENFISVSQIGVEAGTISFADGSTEQTVCIEGQQDAFSFSRAGDDSDSYVYLITNTTNELLAITGENGQFSLGNLPVNDLRVWGLAFHGELGIIPIGTDITSDIFTADCFDLSENSLSIRRILPEGGTIDFVDGGSSRTYCSQESSRRAVVQNNQANSTAYVYLITDQTDVIEGIFNTDSLVFDDLEPGNYRVWGLAYTGGLSAAIGDHAPESILSDDCFDLSDNFLGITIDQLDGGDLSLSNGENELFICESKDEVFLSFTTNQDDAENYLYVVVSLDQEILALKQEAQFSFSEINANEFFVHGLNYKGDLLIQEGDFFAEDLQFSSVCYDLSNRSVFVSVTPTEGGMLSLEDGNTLQVIDCNSTNQLVDLAVAGASGSNYVYYLSNEEEEILAIQENNDQFDLMDFPNGTYHLRAASYSGDLLLQTGQDAQTILISTGCFDLADNRVTVEKRLTLGGTITTAGGANEIVACAPNDRAQIAVELAGSLGAASRVLVTDPRGNILQIEEQDNINLDFALFDTLLVYSLAYNGSLLASLNSNINEILSEGCFELSEAPLLVIKANPAGGTISLADGTSLSQKCTNSTDTIFLNLSGQYPAGNYYYLLTNEDNEFISSTREPSLPVGALKEGTYHIWGLSSTGSLVVQAGDDVTNSLLSDKCFDLSDNFIRLLKGDPQGGLVGTLGGEQSLNACPQQGIPNIVEFESLNTMNTGQVAFLLTDEAGVLISILENAQLDLDTLAAGKYEVRGLTYSGDILVNTGDTLGSSVLASNCGTLSDNAVQLSIELPEGGSISGNGNGGNKICINNIDTQLFLNVSGASTGTNYTYLVTNDVDEFLFSFTEDSIDLFFNFSGNLKVWGLAYNGELSLEMFDNVNEVILADDCYDLSDNVLTIVKEDIDGGSISTVEGNTAAYACPGDGKPDLVKLTNTSSSGSANYAYIITTTDNLIFTAINGDERNFDNIGAFRELRVWGVSYTGTLTLPVFADLFSTVLSDGCYDISDNYVGIFRDEPSAASVGTELGNQNILLCPGRDADRVELTNTSTSLAGYAYLMINTTADSTLAAVITDGGLNIREIEAGDYLMYGLSYTGNILLSPGDTFSIHAIFADNCYELTSTPVHITIGGEVEGGLLSTPTGASVFYTCPFANAGDVVIVNTPEPIEGTDYRLVITDENNDILFPEIPSGLIPFDGALPGEYRIWGVSFTGSYRGQFGRNILEDPLSTDCYTVSDNYVTVISVDPDAGLISTAAGDTEIEVTNDEPLILANTSLSELPYGYLLCTPDSSIVSIFESDTIDLSGVTDGNYLLFGINSAGNLTAAPGQHLINDQLAEHCYILSENRMMLVVNRDGDAQRPVFGEAIKPSAPALSRLQIFPNPASDFLNLSIALNKPGPLLVRVFNRSGQLVRQQKITTNAGLSRLRIIVEDLPADLYILQVQGEDYFEVRRFIKD